MKTLGDQVIAFMDAYGLNAGQMAALVTQSGLGTVSRQNIETVTKGGVQHPRWIQALAYAMNTTSDSLLAGQYAVPAASIAQKVTEGTVNPADLIVTKGSESSSQITIPTSMPYSASNLTATILLLGSLLGALDQRSRKLIGSLLNDLADTPDDAVDIATKSAALATAQRPISTNEALDRALKNNTRSMESQPASLGKK